MTQHLKCDNSVII